MLRLLVPSRSANSRRVEQLACPTDQLEGEVAATGNGDEHTPVSRHNVASSQQEVEPERDDNAHDQEAHDRADHGARDRIGGPASRGRERKCREEGEEEDHPSGPSAVEERPPGLEHGKHGHARNVHRAHGTPPHAR